VVRRGSSGEMQIVRETASGDAAELKQVIEEMK
jgi:hypothetical protein